MSEAMNVETAESLVLHYLAETQERKAPREIQSDLNVNMIMITRALRGAKNRKPALVSLENGKYRFVGNKDVLEPLPDDLKVKFGIGLNEEGNEPSENASSAVGGIAQDLGPIDHQILELLSSRKLLPQSGLMKQFSLAEDEADSILSELEGRELVSSKYLEEFDESAFSLTDKGRSVAEAVLSGEYAPRKEAPKKAAPKVEAAKPAKKEQATTKKAVTKEKEQEPMVSSGRKYTLPNFDEIPEDNAFGRGRPTGDRDFDQLRVYILGYIAEKGSAAKSNISRTLAKILSTFGRTTIVEEVDKLIEMGLVEGAIVGKRELFSLTAKGEDIVEDVVAGRAVPAIGKESVKVSASTTKKPTVSTQAKKPAAAAPKKETKTQAPAKAAPAAAEKPSAPVSPAPAPAASTVASMGSEAHEIAEIQAGIQQILDRMSGEESFELRQRFFELNAEIRELAKSRNELSELCQSLVKKI